MSHANHYYILVRPGILQIHNAITGQMILDPKKTDEIPLFGNVCAGNNKSVILIQYPQNSETLIKFSSYDPDIGFVSKDEVSDS